MSYLGVALFSIGVVIVMSDIEAVLGLGGFVTSPWLEILFANLVGAIALSVSYAIWKERKWARPALPMAVLLAFMVDGRSGSSVVVDVVRAVAVVCFLLWYLYRWPGTVEYYRRLERWEECTDGPSSPAVRADY